MSFSIHLLLSNTYMFSMNRFYGKNNVFWKVIQKLYGGVHRSPNSHGENTVKPTKKRQTNSDHQTLWLGPIEQQRYKR